MSDVVGVEFAPSRDSSVHDSPTMTMAAHRALWDAFYDAVHALEAADYPLPKVVREVDGHFTLVCPWCGHEFATAGTDGAPPSAHRVATAVIYQGLWSIDLDRQGGLTTEPRFAVRMSDSGEPSEDAIAFTCDECDHGIAMPGEVEW